LIFKDIDKNGKVDSKEMEQIVTVGIYMIEFCETRSKRSVEVYRGKNLDPLPPQTVTDISTETKFIALFSLVSSNSNYIVFHILIPQELR
jgi:hypothetical protein